MTQIWRERNEGHIVAVELVQGKVTRAMLVTGEDLESLIATGIPTGANDPDLAEMVDGEQDAFDFMAGE